ncbi:hypothetical protein HELRODRAFT_79507, partial [Helobdella robusta]|uniref:NR LBD domain-containing protein n=1 Tax=Helobdella robusta TaxID=6412 RepID=T1G3P5_HELRO
GGIEYTCPATSSCEITRSRRKACQACRFQKCLQMGMLREGCVRPDRVRGGRQKYRRLNDSPSVVIRASKPPSQRKQSTIGSKLLLILKSIEPEKVFAMPDTTTQDDDFKFKVTISDLTDRELVAIIGWVKQVPDFSTLSLQDQMNLLRSTWLDIVCLNVAYRSLPYDGDIIFADDLKLTEGDACVYGVPGELDRVIRRLIRKLAEVKVNYDEYLLIKALLLFNPDTSLEDVKSVQQQRDNVLDGLLDYEGCHKDSNLPQRVSDLLLILPLIIHARFVMRDFWLAIASDNSIVLHKLLREMLEHAIV